MLALFLTAVLFFLLPVNAGQVQPSSTHDDSSHMITARRSSRTSSSTDEDDEDDQLQGPFFPGAFPFYRPPTPNIPPTSPSVVIKTRTTSAASSDPQPSSPTSPPPPQPHHITSPPQSPPFHVDLPPPPLFHAPPPSSPSSSGPQAVTAGMQHYMDTPVLELWDPMDNQGAGHQFEFIGNGQGGTLELDMSGGIIADDMYFDDEGLGTLEKIYLFARSRANFHRQVSSPSACHIQS